MKVEGTFNVFLRNTNTNGAYHHAGSWRVETPMGDTRLESIDFDENTLFGSIPPPVRGVIRNGDMLFAASFTGKTGARGRVIGLSVEDHGDDGIMVVVAGRAWGVGHYALGRRVTFGSHSFTVETISARYVGSLKELHGRKVNHALLDELPAAIERAEAVKAAAAARLRAAERLYPAPLWAKDARIVRPQNGGRARVEWLADIG